MYISQRFAFGVWVVLSALLIAALIGTHFRLNAVYGSNATAECVENGIELGWNGTASELFAECE
jgi:hypothetical protein